MYSTLCPTIGPSLLPIPIQQRRCAADMLTAVRTDILVTVKIVECSGSSTEKKFSDKSSRITVACCRKPLESTAGFLAFINLVCGCIKILYAFGALYDHVRTL